MEPNYCFTLESLKYFQLSVGHWLIIIEQLFDAKLMSNANEDCFMGILFMASGLYFEILCFICCLIGLSGRTNIGRDAFVTFIFILNFLGCFVLLDQMKISFHMIHCNLHCFFVILCYFQLWPFLVDLPNSWFLLTIELMKALFKFHWNLYPSQQFNCDLLTILDGLKICLHQLVQFAYFMILSLKLILKIHYYFTIQSFD